MRARRTVLLVALALLALLRGASAGGTAVIVTEHLEVSGDVPFEWVKTASDLGEAAWESWTATFGREPESAFLPLVLRLLPDRASFVAAARDAGAVEDLSRLGGWTSWEAPYSVVWLQQEPFDTRRLVLHELTHQFQALAFRDARPRDDPFWHREGTAEHVGWHRRTAKGLVLGERDVVARAQRPLAAARRVVEPDYDPWAIATGARPCDYTDALLLVGTFLRTKDETLRTLYAGWQAGAFTGRAGMGRFALTFAGKEDAVRAAAKEVWSGWEPTWHTKDPGWDEEAGGIRHAGTEESVLAGRPLGAGVPARVSAIMTRSAGGAGGLALGFDDPVVWVAVILEGGADRFALRRLDRRSGASGDIGPSPGAVPLLLEADAESVTVHVGSTTTAVRRASLGIPAEATFTRVGLYASGAALFALPRVGSEARAPTPGNR